MHYKSDVLISDNIRMTYLCKSSDNSSVQPLGCHHRGSASNVFCAAGGSALIDRFGHDQGDVNWKVNKASFLSGTIHLTGAQVSSSLEQ